jgi:hypothetical protein
MVYEPDTYASLEIKKLRELHEIALKNRLDTKKKMRGIVVYWMNIKLSQYFL